MYLQCPDFQSLLISTQKAPTSRINEARNENTVNLSGMLSSIQTANGAHLSNSPHFTS